MKTYNNSWTEEMLTAWKQTRGTIYSVLNGSGRARDVDDVWQKTWLAAAENLDAYDPSRGTFRQWIGGIADKQARRHVRDDYRRNRLDDEIEHAADSGITTVYDVVAESSAEQVVARLGDWNHASEVLAMVRQVMKPELFERSMHLIVACEGDVARAAKQLGVQAPALRDSHRNVMDMVHVVDKALRLHWNRREHGAAGSSVKVRDLLACLPHEDEASRVWQQVITRAVIVAGGFAQVTPSQIAGLIGWSESYCRQCLKRTAHLLMVARSVIENGRLD
ncbi:hypothetical protein NBM05_07305 [Rothia sp. AR01]|uniref:RNA polymerase sigma-70 region 2 domain-containing protein n=1 Tax=Rothia santali TaxID=2949643 RepID=A0A9X2HDQ3_9MICC|nr:sigma factor [Rothia santali]MCP3425817.1 hypothetical protein [Rothia santali]